MKEINLTPYILPTDEASQIYLIKDTGKLGYTSGDPFYTENYKNSGTQNHHLYLCSSEEIKEGDWAIHNDITKKVESDAIVRFANEQKCPKIILTTDPALIAEGVQKIDGDTKAVIEIDYLSPFFGTLKRNAKLPFLSEFCKRWNDKGKVKSEGYFNSNDLVDLLKECKLQIEYFNKRFTPTETASSVISMIESNIQSLTMPSTPSLSISYNTETRSLTIK